MANGKFGGGKGTTANPYIIEDIWDFNKIRFYVTKCFKIVNDIDFSIPPFNEGFLPIANFVGQLDGNGHKLSNLYIKRVDLENVGLFSKISFANNSYVNQRPFIKNLVIENADVTGNLNVGILIGKMEYTYNWGAANFGSILSNIYVSGKVQGNVAVGSLIGYLTFSHNNYANTFASNIYIDTYLYPQVSNTYTSPVYGYVQCNSLNYVNTITLLRDSYVKCKVASTHVVLNEAYVNVYLNSNVVCTTSYYYRFTNNIYDDNWNTFTSSFITLDNKEHYSISSNIVDWVSALVDSSAWRLSYNRPPILDIISSSEYFIKYNNKYYTYVDSEFKEVYIKDYQHAFDQGLDSLPSLGAEFFTKLKKLTGGNNCSIVNIINDSKGLKVNEMQTFSLTKDTKHTSNKVLFSSKFNFTNNVTDNQCLYKMVKK